MSSLVGKDLSNGNRHRKTLPQVVSETCLPLPSMAMLTLPLQETAGGLPPEEKAAGIIPLSVYYRYFRAGGSKLLLSATAFVFVISEVRMDCKKYTMPGQEDS